MTTGAQIRAARELLGWRQAELAKRARIQAHSIESAESSLGQSFVPGQDMQAMRADPAELTAEDDKVAFPSRLARDLGLNKSPMKAIASSGSSPSASAVR